jgi:hypothetical protein
MCASGPRDVVTVPTCPGPESRQPVADAAVCDERELAEYTADLTDRIMEPDSRALVRVEFDRTARVRSVCVDEHTGDRAWNTGREIAEKLVEMHTIPPGPQCVAGKRIDLNLYEAKLAETKNAEAKCGLVVGKRMKALRPCKQFDSDWILYDRIGSTRPYLYVRLENVPASADQTLRQCERATHGFEDQSECIQADGFELVTPPPR